MKATFSNGLMIDCSRLKEPHAYYYKLIDFMADWGMDTLLLHFADDHGLGVQLPGFESLALPNAFSADELRQFIAHADAKGIDVIPELETFGHTKFITFQSEYRHLFAGDHFREAGFSAVDPKHPETIDLMKRLIQATADLFPSPFLHAGCDEVGMTEYCEKRGLDEAETWSGYVNEIIGLVRDVGKTPMIWGDHPAKDATIAKALRKDVWVIRWSYVDDADEQRLLNLIDAGFENILTGPSIACFRYRFLPPEPSFANVARLTEHARKHLCRGVVNTIWCPWRYLQNAMWYGIARGADIVRLGDDFDLDAFHERFADKTFGLPLSEALSDVLSEWPKIWIDKDDAGPLLDPDGSFDPERLGRLRIAIDRANALLALAEFITPKRGKDVWNGMLLATRTTRLCAEFALANGVATPDLKRERESVKAAMSAEWDLTRYPDDPQKWATSRGEGNHQYAMLLIEGLGERRSGGKVES